MKNIDYLQFYSEVIELIDLGYLYDANKIIKKNIKTLMNLDDIALAHLICGFINDKLGDYTSAIEDFSKSICFESQLEIITKRSKDISFNARSNSRYKKADYQGAIEDKINAKKIRLLEIELFLEIKNNQIDYKDILLGTFVEMQLEPKYHALIKVSTVKKSRYDLISDYKKVISQKKKDEVIRKLEFLSESKYKVGDYKGSIKAIRRAEKYY